MTMDLSQVDTSTSAGQIVLVIVAVTSLIATLRSSYKSPKKIISLRKIELLQEEIDILKNELNIRIEERRVLYKIINLLEMFSSYVRTDLASEGYKVPIEIDAYYSEVDIERRKLISIVSKEQDEAQ